MTQADLGLPISCPPSSNFSIFRGIFFPTSPPLRPPIPLVRICNPSHSKPARAAFPISPPTRPSPPLARPPIPLVRICNPSHSKPARAAFPNSPPTRQSPPLVRPSIPLARICNPCHSKPARAAFPNSPPTRQSPPPQHPPILPPHPGIPLAWLHSEFRRQMESIRVHPFADHIRAHPCPSVDNQLHATQNQLSLLRTSPHSCIRGNFYKEARARGKGRRRKAKGKRQK